MAKMPFTIIGHADVGMVVYYIILIFIVVRLSFLILKVLKTSILMLNGKVEFLDLVLKTLKFF